jgi:hypothetical protein
MRLPPLKSRGRQNAGASADNKKEHIDESFETRP